MIPVVLSGGVGSRLWPLSRGMYPKQLLPLVDSELTLLQQTMQRVAGMSSIEDAIVVCNEEHRFMVGEQLHKIGMEAATILLEPEGRNTAPAIGLAAAKALKMDSEALLLVMPADHVVDDVNCFHRAVEQAQEHALRGDLVTFGVVAARPETGFGYIKGGEKLVDGAFKVEAFKEKPEINIAQQYVESGEYYWNSGIFLFKADSYLAELKRFEERVFSACTDAIKGAKADLDFWRIDAEAFSKAPSISIDYAVMENTDKAIVVPLDLRWSDVGSWSALWEVTEKDENGNALVGDVLVDGTSNSYVRSESKLVSVIGIDSAVVVETDDAVLVTDMKSSQRVKETVKQLEELNRSQRQHHRKVFRPWGWYDSVDVGERFQVKRIQVKPGAKLSVQMHNHRAEHWVVVKGVAEVLNGDDTIILNENESTFIPIGTVHALKNPSASIPLEIIEVQSGAYLGEDDIVRFEDLYGRIEGVE